MLKTPLSALAAVLLISSWSFAVAPRTWEYAGSGQWQPVSDRATTQPTADPTLDRVEQYLQNGQANAAKSVVINWLKNNRRSPARDRALFLTAEALYQYGDRVKAYYYLDELMDEYPESRLYYPALEKQYQIADTYLRGYKRRFLRIPMFRAPEEAVEMLYRIQQRAPGSPLAEKSLLRTADYYYATSEFDFAADAYGAYTRTYPRSPNIPRVRLRQAYASLAQFRGAKFDATPIIDAREQLGSLMAQYPDLAAEENLPTVVERIDASFARKLYLTADFYRRTTEPRAAVYTYRYLIKAYPDSPEARLAQARLNRMPRWTLNVPEPAVVSGYAPGSTETREVR
jgi:outer membrane assembly lipoprotein YfiO